MTKKKKVVTPLKDINVAVEDASQDSGTTEAEYQNMPESIVDSLMRPEPVVDRINREINEEYPWVVSSITTTQRAMLCELVRIRHLLEQKNA